MKFIQDSIRGNYLRGVNNLIGIENVNGKMRRCVLDAECADATKMPEMYYLLTRELIEGMSSDDCKLSDNFKRAMSEAIGIKLWGDQSGDYKPYESIMPENYIQRFVGESLMANIGERETIYMALTDPDAFGEFLDSIPYNHGTFLTYFNFMLDQADKQQIIAEHRVQNIGDFNYVLDCMDAIFTCSENLRVPGKRMKKVLEKAKNKDNENERERE